MTARPGALAGSGQLVRLVLRRDRVRLPVWLVAVLGLVYASAAAVQSTYGTPEQREVYARTIGESPASIAFSGPPVALDTLGGVTVFEVNQTTVLAVALMAVFLTVRHTRAEEEAGRAELLHAAPVGAAAPLAAALAVVGAACVVAGIGVAAVFLGLGLPSRGSLVYGASVAALGLCFAVVAACAAQVTEHTRGALGLAGTALAVAFVVRAAGDVAGSWLVWASPIGWSQAVHAFDPAGGDRWAPLLVPAAFVAVLGTLTLALLHHRDLGAGLVPPRPGPAGAGPLLAGVPGLTLRLQRGALAGWAAGLFLGGLTMGSVSGDVRELVETNEQLAEFFAARGDVVDAFLTTVLLVLALVAGGFAVSSVLRMHAEETAGRAELLLATGLSRWRWTGGSLLVTVPGIAAVVAAGGSGLGVAHALVTGDAAQVLRLAGFALVFLPAPLVLAGLAVLLLGWLPGAAPAAWAALAGCLVIGWLGDLLGLPAAVRDLSPFSHVPRVPLEPVTVGPLAGLTALAVVLGAAGLVGFRRRDVG